MASGSVSRVGGGGGGVVAGAGLGGGAIGAAVGAVIVDGAVSSLSPLHGRHNDSETPMTTARATAVATAARRRLMGVRDAGLTSEGAPVRSFDWVLGAAEDRGAVVAAAADRAERASPSWRRSASAKSEQRWNRCSAFFANAVASTGSNPSRSDRCALRDGGGETR